MSPPTQHCRSKGGTTSSHSARALAKAMKNVLFVCSQNRLRSPTAEQIFAGWPGIEVASAGTDLSADQPVSPELLAWADTIFLMESAHRRKLSTRFRSSLNGQRLIVLGIPDNYRFMQPALIEILRERVTPYLPGP